MLATAEIDHPAWYRATTLKERVSQTSSDPTLASAGIALAQQRLQRWRQLGPFQDNPLFAERLASEGMTEGDLMPLLGEADIALRNRLKATPSWLNLLDQAFRDDASPSQDEGSDAGNTVADYVSITGPLLRWAQRRLRARLQRMPQAPQRLPFDPETAVTLLINNLPQQMYWTLARTVALEIYIAKLEEKLSGETPEERYRSFFARLADPQELRRLYQTYPVLVRLLIHRFDNWCEASLELLERWANDWPVLCKVFSPAQDPGPVIAIQSGLGDRHLGGRTVCSLHFAAGLRLIYKPQPMSVATHFGELLQWLNRRGLSPHLQHPKVLDRGTYGWVEFIEAAPCTSVEGVRRFYQRQGSHLAILHALGGADMHSENLIARGEHPILIDFETVIQPHWQSGHGAGPLTEMTKKALEGTVLRIGLLPVPRSSETVDRSGLGSASGQQSSCPQLVDAGTDELHFERRMVTLQDNNHRPRLVSASRGVVAMDVNDYSTELRQGFEHTYRLLLEHRKALLAPKGPLHAFQQDTVRIVVRPTRAYSSLLHESYHPYFLGNALDRHRHFDHLWFDADVLPCLKQIIPFEYQALDMGDIPYFSTRLDGRGLFAEEHQSLPNFLPTSGYQQLRQRVQGLSAEDLERQLALINNTLVAQRSNRDHLAPSPAGYAVGSPPKTAAEDSNVLRQRLLAAAQQVGRRLETLALRSTGSSGQDVATWIQPSVTADGQCVLVPMSSRLYGGLPGVALFLAQLDDVSGEEHFTALARAALGTVQLQLTEDRHDLETPGAFDGWGGLIYTYLRLSQMWDEPKLLARANDLLDRLPPLIETDPHCDVISGVAGLIPVLLSLHRSGASPRALELAMQCGQQLVAMARPQNQGIGWPTRRSGRALAGFSHGAAGIAWALVELAAAVGEGTAAPGRLDQQLFGVARSALRYERSLFDRTTGGWQDLRSQDTRHGPASAQVSRATWCNGAPGIGLSRLAMLRHQDSPTWSAEVDDAMRAMHDEPQGISHSLCHGDLGNLEFLVEAAQVLGSSPQSGPRNRIDWEPQIAHRSRLVLEDIERRGYLDGTLPGMQSPGLMNGLAGIGYGLLRLADPCRVPSVLLLADAPARGRDTSNPK